MSELDNCYNIGDLRAAARRRLPRGIFEYVDRGTEDEVALAENRAAINRIKLVPRAPVDVSARSTATALFGQDIGMPLAIAPTGAAGVMWHKGEIALARAAKAAGVPFTLATGSMTALDELAREVQGRHWLQLYVWRDRSLSYDLVRRAADAGYEALVVTVDTPVLPNRDYNIRNGFGVPFRPTVRNVTDMLLHPRWVAGTLLPYLRSTGMPRLENHPPEFNASATRAAMAPRVALSDTVDWSEIRRLRDRWPRKLMVKGILHPQDALDAVEAGADGVIVSNHGGRNLDGAIASFDALPAIAGAIRDRATVIVDSGVRRGSDILKAVALGAHAVQVGRATLYGTAAGGQAGAARALEILRYELDVAMANTGCVSIGSITGAILAPHRHPTEMIA